MAFEEYMMFAVAHKVKGEKRRKAEELKKQEELKKKAGVKNSNKKSK
ncbi:hypothetical protein [Priestia megaterium]|nr:hypothetical protein [Priestia megaterium]